MSQSSVMNLLPLYLRHGKTYELPIVIGSCSQVVLHELIYRNKEETDMILDCKVHVNGKTAHYFKDKGAIKTYNIDGEKNKKMIIPIDSSGILKVSLEISCRNFDACHCREQQFQLNVSAIYD